MRICFYILLFLFFSLYDLSGQGTLRGKISDENGDPLIGATLIIKGQTLAGTVADYDGNYSIKINSSDPQFIEISFIGYNTIRDTVYLRKGEVLVNNYGLVSALTTIGEITITARVVKGKESYMEKVKLSTGTFIDFISTETIKRTGDANVSAAVSRITGVSSYAGFVTVRGLSDRYIKTTVNGLRIPTLDPFTNNIKLDLFPAYLVDNIIVNKTFSPDLPGDWTGAFINIETKDYPEKFSLNFESSFGFNTNSTFKNTISSQRSRTDWLGFDNGLRDITHQKAAPYYPEIYGYKEFANGLNLKNYFYQMGIDENTPWLVDYSKLALVELGFLDKANIYDNQEYNKALAEFNASELKIVGLLKGNADVIDMGTSLSNTWQTTTRKAPLDFSQNLSIGNQTKLFNRPFGYLFGVRYSSSSTFNNDSFTGRTTLRTIDELKPEDINYSYITHGKGQNSIVSNGWSALVNLSYKINDQNSVSLVFMPNIIGVGKTRKDYFYSFSTGSPYFYVNEAQHYESRQQLVYQIKSEHFIPSLKMKIGFNASYTNGDSKEPDFKQLLYEYDKANNNLPTRLFTLNVSNTTFRNFRTLSEDLIDLNLSAEVPVGNNQGLQRKIKFGGAYQHLLRKSDQYFYYLPASATSAGFTDGDITEYLSHEKFTSVNNEGEILRFYSQLSGPLNNTIGFSKSFAGYIMTDYALTRRLRLSGGVRIEKKHLHTDIEKFYSLQLPVNDERRITGDNRSMVNPGIKNNLALLPSLNIVYYFKRDEASQVNLKFNFSKTSGSPSLRESTNFSVYDYSLMGSVTGNPNLDMIKILNFDLRSEAFFKTGNDISLSFFYKDFTNHIELIRDEQFDVFYTWQNAETSHIMGIELEGRFGITKNIEFRANTTFVKSKTVLKDQSIARPMFGQAPYIVNCILVYLSDKAGFEASASYNLQGPKLVITSTVPDSPDIYEVPRNLVDIKLGKKIGKHFNVSLKVRDLFNNPQRRAYKFNKGWLDFDRNIYGTTYLFVISYSL